MQEGEPVGGVLAAPTAAGRSDPSRLAGLNFHDVFELARDIVLLSDTHGMVVGANRAAREMAGYDAAEVEGGIALRTLMRPDEFQAAELLTQRAFAGLPIPEVYERDAVLRDGSHRILELRSSVVRLPDGEMLLQTIGRDVTDSRSASAFQLALFQVSQALLTTHDTREVGKVVCREARRVLDVDGVYVWLREGDELVAVAGDGVGSEGTIGMRRSFDDPSVRDFVEQRGPVVRNDLQEATGGFAVARASGVQALMTVPLRRGGEPFGFLLLLDLRRPGMFTPSLCDRAMIFGAQTAVAIENALSRQREAEEAEVSSALLQVTRSIRESLEESEVVDRVAASLREIIDCDSVFVSVWLPDRDAFRVARAVGWSPDVIEELLLLEFSAKEFPVAAALSKREFIERVDVDLDAAPIYARYNARTQFAAPMVHGGKLIGGLHLFFHQRVTQISARERRILEGIAAQAAVAVDNARLIDDLRRASQLKSDFLGTMSHELRTPLAAILGYADLMRDAVLGSVSVEQQQALERVLINGRGLLDLIDIVLDVNRLESGRLLADKSSFSVAELIAELQQEDMRLVAPNIGMIWGSVSADLVLHSDRSKLKVVLRSLINNALKFTREGHVTLQVLPRGNELLFRVSDTGIGIAQDKHAMIFDMFTQVETARQNSRSGVGLGLYLVRRYTELLGGEISLESTPGQGSTFSVELPYPG